MIEMTNIENEMNMCEAIENDWTHKCKILDIK